MIRNYFTTALRNLSRNRLYTVINIIGLAVGLACFVLILLFVRDELSYDRYHTKADRIYRLCEKIELEGQGENSSSNPFPTGPAIQNDHPHLVEEVVRFFNFQTSRHTLRIDDQKFSEPQIFFADSNLFRVFDFPLSMGNPTDALKGPNKIILTQELAQKYFGDADPIGKQVLYQGTLPVQVTGVFGDIPPQSHFQFKALISFATLKPFMGSGLTENWVWNPNWTYILLKEGVKTEELEAQFPVFVEKYYPDFIKSQITHYFQPLTDIHLHSDLDYEIEPNNKRANIFIFSAIGIFILLIACINFMNLATARSVRRAQEVGVRKVMGADRSQLMLQFLGESTLMSVLAMFLALWFISLLMPVFNDLSGKSLDMGLLLQGKFIAGLLGLTLTVGILAGFYPAIFLSGFSPVKVLKGKLRADRGNRVFREALVVLQFAISLALIISTFIIYRQHQFLSKSDPGFQKDHIMVIPMKTSMVPKYEVFKEDLLRNPGVLAVSKMNEVIGVHHNVHEYNYEGMTPGEWIYFPSLIVDEDFVPTMGLEVVAGRNFSKDYPTDDSLGLLINETMVKELGWGSPDEALNRQFYTPRGREKVIGVVKDFHAVSLVDPIRPFVLDMQGNMPFFARNVVARIRSEGFQETLNHIETSWGLVAPEHPLEYSFLNEQMDQLYASHKRQGDLVAIFSGLAIFIACMGLFALASFMAEQRTKEIGIRKVLGASLLGIVKLMARDFLRLVLLANLIAWPITWYVMQDWLSGFAFRLPMPWWAFVLAAAGVLLLALLTVVFQALKAGMTNPVWALKEE